MLAYLVTLQLFLMPTAATNNAAAALLSSSARKKMDWWAQNSDSPKVAALYKTDKEEIKKKRSGPQIKAQTALPVGIRPNSDAKNERLFDYTSNDQLLTGVLPKKSTPSGEFLDVQDAAYERYNKIPQKAYPDTPDVTLTKGTMRGGTVNKQMLYDLIDSADKNNIPRNTMLAIAANESMFGKGYRGGERREKGSRGALQQNIVSGWDVDNQYKPVSDVQFAYGKGIPYVSLEKKNIGYKYPISNIDKYHNSLDSALTIHPEWIDEYRRAQANVRSKGEINYFDETAKIIKRKGPGVLNPGDPNYTARINAMAGDIASDPGIQTAIKQRTGAAPKQSENNSDTDALKFLLKKRGLYDAAKEGISADALKKATADDVIKRSPVFKRLRESFDDKELLQIMNKAAGNKNTNKSTKA